MNFDFVTDRMAIGSTPETVEDVRMLLSAGITHIIGCQLEHDGTALFAGSGITYLWVPTADWNPLKPEHKPLEWFRAGVEFGLPVLCRPKTRILCQCHLGVNRSGVMAYTMLRAYGATHTQAFAAIDLGRLIDIPGLLETGWWRDSDKALTTLGYI